MVKVAPSAFLRERTPYLKAVVIALRKRFDYASILGTDSVGLLFQATTAETKAQDSDWGERGFVVRVQRGGAVAEYSFNRTPDLPAERFADEIAGKLERLFGSGGVRRYPQLPDEQAKAQAFAEIASDPFAEDPKKILDALCGIRDVLMGSDGLVPFARVGAEFMRVSKVFVSPNRELEQSFVWAQGYVVAMTRRGDIQRFGYTSYSGRKGVELLDEMRAGAAGVRAEAVALLDAVTVEPGEYEVILSPVATGLLAHEAFGHGVETDMFAKNRAIARDYLGKDVASKIVTMYDGAAGVEENGTYLFDDEGTLSTKTTVIENGELKAGISDLLSALALGSAPTGNGRRQNFAHKAYARMTNTYFEPGSSDKDALIASVKYGWMLCDMDSGMEDPKNWGIQLVFNSAKEIKDGKFTGRYASPVVCSGYVPEVLSNITMVSKDFELSGSGYCGKGYKEFVKVSAGGPYVKTKMRLG